MVKVGDKVRVTTDTYGPRHPKGTLGTVGHVWSNRDIVMIDGRGRERYIFYGEYDCDENGNPIMDTGREVG